MEKNENGLPRRSGRCECGRECGLESLKLGYSYTPIQCWRLLYRPEEALSRGTLFEELYKPKEVYGRETK